MNILEKIEYIEKINESGIRNIKKLKSQFDKAEIYFHMDLDGVTSALGMKNYLENNGFEVIDVFPIQYGGTEYAVPKGRKDVMKVLVDFAHGKPMFHIHQDHHEGQVGVKKGTSTDFKTAPSGAGIISGTISPKDIFPPKDLEIINTVDSADFVKQGLTPDDIISATFNINKSIPVKKNHQMMGLVVNKLLLSYKNKPNFLKNVVLKSKPSLISMFNVIKKLAKKEGYKTPDEIDLHSKNYQKDQKSKMIKDSNIKDVKNLKSGQSIKIGNLIVQYAGGSMAGAKQYDRYTPFKLYPDANYYTIAWPVGIIQLSQNPFKKIDKDLHLGEIVMKDVMEKKFKSILSNIDITLDTIKYQFESDIIRKKIKNAVGFTFSDFIALYDKQIKNLSKTGKYKDMIKNITTKSYQFLSDKQKDVIKKVTVSAWDVIMAGSGGHKKITNISGINFIKKDQYPGGYVSLIHDIQYEIAKRMMDE
jgi:hypothetical protein